MKAKDRTLTYMSRGWWRALVIEYARDDPRYLGSRPGGWVAGQVPGRLKHLVSF